MIGRTYGHRSLLGARYGRDTLPAGAEPAPSPAESRVTRPAGGLARRCVTSVSPFSGQDPAPEPRAQRRPGRCPGRGPRSRERASVHVADDVRLLRVQGLLRASPDAAGPEASVWSGSVVLGCSCPQSAARTRQASRGAPHRRRARPHDEGGTPMPGRPLADYKRKRDFAKTPEPAGGGPRTVGRRAAVRRAAAPRAAAALRLPAGDRRGAGQLGRAEGADARPDGPSHGRARGGSPGRVLRLRGRDPGRRVRRRRRHRLGQRGVGAARHGRSRRGRGRRRAAPRHVRAEAPRPLRAGPPGRRRRSGGARSSGSCCTSATTTPSRAGTRRSIRARCSAAGPTTRSRPTRTGCGARTRPAARGLGRASAAGGGGPERRRPGRAGRARQGRHVDGVRARAAPDQPRQGALPGAARAEPPVTKREFIAYAAQDRAARPAVPARPGPEPAPIPGRRGQEGVLAQAAARRTRPRG